MVSHPLVILSQVKHHVAWFSEYRVQASPSGRLLQRLNMHCDNHLTLKIHPGHLATTLPSMWHWTAALRAQSQPVACSSHTHSSINSPSFQLRNCELIRPSVTSASPCWGHYLDQTPGSKQGFTLGWMALVIVWATDEQNWREKLRTRGDYDGRKWDKLCLCNKSHRNNIATMKLSSTTLWSLYSKTLSPT